MSLHDYSSPERRKKKLFRLPSFTKKNSVAGHYNYFSDDDPEPSFEDLPLGIHGNHGWSYDFDLDGDSDSEAELNDDALMKPPSKYAQIHFHTNFDDDEHEVPKPCTSERHQSTFMPRPPSPPTSSYSPASYLPKSTQVSYAGHAYEADSDTSCTVESEDEYDDPTYTLPKKRTIRFADEEGYELQTIYITDRDKDDADEHLYHIRIIVLLLNPKKKQFEFLHLTTPRDDRTYLSEAIKLFPDLASDSSFTKQKYVGLCRPTKDGQELINSLCIQDYDLDRDEILVAIPSGMKGKTIVKISEPLVNDGNVKKMVRRKMRSGFAVQSLPHAIEMSREAHAEAESETSVVLDESVQSGACSDSSDAQEKSVEPDEKQASSNEEMASELEANREKDEAIQSTELMTFENDIVTVKGREESTSDEIPVEDGTQKGYEISDATVADETVSETNQDDEESTSSSVWVKATSIAKGFMQAYYNDKDEKNDKDELKQITEYIDELQRDVASEMESMNDEFNSTYTVPSINSTTDEIDDGDIDYLFKPVESALDDALEDFNVTAGEGSDIDESIEAGSVDASMDAEFESDDKSDIATESAAAVLATIVKDVSDTANSPKLVVSSVSEDVVSGDSEDEEVLAKVCEKERQAAAREDKTNDTRPENDDSDLEKCNAVCEVESNDGSASFVVSSIDSKERYGNDGEHLRHYSSSDGDEDDSDGAFPAMEALENVDDKDGVKDVPVTDKVEDEMEDIPEIHEEREQSIPEIGGSSSSKEDEAADSLYLTNSMMEVLEKRGLSFVQAHAKHLASGSFRSHDEVADDNGNVPDMESVLVELDDPKDVSSDSDEQKRKRFILFHVFIVTMGFLLRGFRKKKTSAKF